MLTAVDVNLHRDELIHLKPHIGRHTHIHPLHAKIPLAVSGSLSLCTLWQHSLPAKVWFIAALDTLSAPDFVGTRFNQQIVSVSVPKCWHETKKNKNIQKNGRRMGTMIT